MFCWMFLRPISSSRDYFYFFLIPCGTISPKPPRMLTPLDWKIVSMLALTAFGRSPPPPLTHLTDLPKIIEKRGLIQKSFKWAQNHERTMSGSIEKASRHFLKPICQIPSRRYEYLHNLINAATYLFNSARRKTPLNENMFSIVVLSAFEHSDPLTTTH